MSTTLHRTLLRRVRGSFGTTFIVVALGLTGAGTAAVVTADASARPENVDSVAPARVLDTREGGRGQSVPGRIIEVAIPQAAQAGATSVVLNLTATNGAADGWVKAWPCGEPVPATSSLNFSAAQSVANAVMVKLPARGVCLASSQPVDLIADVSGWYTGNQDFIGTSPNRLLDTRINNQPLQPGVERRLTVAGVGGIGANATIAALNLTVDRPGQAGWVVAYPCGQPTNSSTVNFRAGDIVANLTVVGLTSGDVCLRALVETQLVVDSYGWSAGAGQLKVGSPSRLLDTREPSTWPAGRTASHATVELNVAGRNGVPANAAAALITVTVVNPESAGFVTVWPCDEPFPLASTINTFAGALRSNLALVKLSASQGSTCLQYRSATLTGVDLVVDVVGWTTGGPSRTPPPGAGGVTPPTTPPPGVVPPAGGSLQPRGTVLWAEDFSAGTSMSRLTMEIHTDGSWPPKAFGGDHDHSCGSPTTHRPLNENYQLDTHFWHCAPGSDPAKGHFMTGMNTEGYVIVAFSPKDPVTGRAMIFPGTANQICWDQNLTDLGGRKWTQLAVVSDDTYLANNPTAAAPKMAFRNPDFDDVAGETSLSIGDDGFLFNNLRNSVEFFTGTGDGVVVDEMGLPGITDKATRYETCVRDNLDGTVTRTQARPGAVDVRTGPGRFPSGPRVFILEDDSYNAMKDYDGPIPLSSNPYTWHWDNIEIS